MQKVSSGRDSLNVAGLFAGIGGLEAGLSAAGHATKLLCELDPAAIAVLEERVPGVPISRDINTLSKLPRGIDLVVAGFPCQDLSQAGATRGIKGRQSGLIDQVFRLLESGRVPWVLLENVPFMLQLGRGAAIRHVVDCLESLGYSWAYRVVDTRAFGLPQRRERVYLLASIDEDPSARLFAQDRGAPDDVDWPGLACGFYWTEGLRGLGWAIDAVPTLKGGSTVGIPSPPAIWMTDGRIVTPELRDAERLQGFPPGWTEPAESAGRASYRWKLVGNAVTVDVARWLGELLASPPPPRPVLGVPLHTSAAWPRAAWGSREGRFTSPVSAWPLRKKAPHLDAFLRYEPKPLSRRALDGF